MEKAIRSHADHFQENHPEIVVQLDLMKDGKSLPEQSRLGLFRIYQQLLSNVIRHAGANRLIIRLHLDDECVTLEVEDNGCGFDVPRKWIDLVRNGHFGLVGASERAEALGGRLEIESQPGKGALVRAVIPRLKV